MLTPDIDITPLKRAMQRLEEGLTALDTEPENTLARDGVIQRFEFTYELSHRMLRRYLESVVANPEEIAALSFQDLIRVAGDRRLVRSPWPVWRDFRQARTDTSHTYNEGKAKQVLAAIPEFVSEVKGLIEAMEERLAEA